MKHAVDFSKAPILNNLYGDIKSSNQSLKEFSFSQTLKCKIQINKDTTKNWIVMDNAGRVHHLRLPH